MPFFTYTVQRSMEKTNFYAMGTDISSSSIDDSFNSVTTDLSGIPNGKWIYLTGLIDAGWHQLAVDSTATQILSANTLTTEAAGAPVTIQGYERGFGSSHSFDFNLESASRTPETRRNTAVAHSGITESIRTRHDVFWDIVPGVFPAAMNGVVREFLQSVDNGEPFTFDPHGTMAAPIQPMTVIRTDDSYTETIMPGGYFRVSFRVREVAPV